MFDCPVKIGRIITVLAGAVGFPSWDNNFCNIMVY